MPRTWSLTHDDCRRLPSPEASVLRPEHRSATGWRLVVHLRCRDHDQQVTYSNPDTLTPNTNPIVLDSTGSCVCFLDATLQYEFTLSPAGDTDPPTNPIYSVDQVGYADILQGYAPLASPAFTGNPTAPTPTVGDNSTSIATTQFVDQAITNAQSSPSLSGTPVAPTASPGTLTTQIATTAFVGAEIARAQSM